MAEENASPISAAKPPVTNPIKNFWMNLMI